MGHPPPLGPHCGTMEGAHSVGVSPDRRDIIKRPCFLVILRAMGNSLYGSPAREPEGGLVYKELYETDEEQFWKQTACLWELSEGNFEGGFFFGNPEELHK